MVDLHGKNKGNISLPARLQSPDPQNIKEDEEQPMIINMQRAMYETRIKDLEQRIERLQLRNEYLEKYCATAQSISDSKNREAEDTIVDLNNSIDLEMKKIDDIKKKCEELDEIRKEQSLNHLQKVKEMERKFEETRIKHYSQVKLMNAKINSIEEFKSMEESLKTKFDNQNKLYMEKENIMQQILDQIEYKSKIHKENLKKEAYKQTLDVSENFQQELKSIIPYTVQRLMRENIVVENELVQLRNDYANMTDKKSEYEKDVYESKEKIKEAKNNIKHRMIISKMQTLLLKKLKLAHKIVKCVLYKPRKPTPHFEENYLKIVDNAKHSEYVEYDFRRRQLEVMLHQERIKLESVKQIKSKTSNALTKYCQTISKLKHIVNSALSISNVNMHKKYKHFKNMDLESLALHLIDLIENCNFKNLISDVESIETIFESTNVYAIGDLGFEPDHIELEDIIVKKREKTASTREEIFEILKELEKIKDLDAQKSISSEKSVHDSISALSVSSQIDVKSKLSEELVDIERMKTSESSFDIEYKYEMENEYDYIDYENK